MRLSWKWLIPAAIVTAIAVVGAGLLLLRPDPAIITAAGFDPPIITPNADGDRDVTVFSYALSQNAVVDIWFEREDGRKFVFRQGEDRAAGDYEVLFSGVVDGFVEEGEAIEGDVLRRLMPDGVYTWTLNATTEDGRTATRTGTLELTGGTAALPEIPEFSVLPESFTPNQDGISDRTAINVGLAEAADLLVYLQAEGGQPIYIPERLDGLDPDAPSLRHYYDYDGGVDLGADPPADGVYAVIAETQDAVGQRVRRQGTLEIAEGGRPLAQIVPQPSGATVSFEAQPYDPATYTTADDRGQLIPAPASTEGLSSNAITMQVGDMLVFRLTVENYGSVPIRTSGSPPGTVYDWSQRASTLGEFDESGSWRVGIDCDTAGSVYPWRWRLGAEQDLEERVDPATGQSHWYLLAGGRAVVWGGVRMSEIEARNPQNCWAGLIHEDVGISQLNDSVGPRRIYLVDPSGAADGAASKP